MKPLPKWPKWPGDLRKDLTLIILVVLWAALGYELGKVGPPYTRCIVYVGYDVTHLLPDDWQKMKDWEIKEYIDDWPEIVPDLDPAGPNIVSVVERK